MFVHVRAGVCVCVCACGFACVRACVRVRACARVRACGGRGGVSACVSVCLYVRARMYVYACVLSSRIVCSTMCRAADKTRSRWSGERKGN